MAYQYKDHSKDHPFQCDCLSEMQFFHTFENSQLGKWYNTYMEEHRPFLDKPELISKNLCSKDPVSQLLWRFSACNALEEGRIEILQKLKVTRFTAEDAQVVFATQKFLREYYNKNKYDIRSTFNSRDSFRDLLQAVFDQANAIKRSHLLIRHNILLGMGKFRHENDEEMDLNEFIEASDKDMFNVLYDDRFVARISVSSDDDSDVGSPIDVEEVNPIPVPDSVNGPSADEEMG